MAGRKIFTAGSILTAADVNGYLMNQVLQRFASNAARDASITVPAEAYFVYTDDLNRQWTHDGTTWKITGGSMPRVRCTNSAAQSLASGGNTVITWNTETYDTDALHDTATNPGRFTVPAGMGGMWRVDANFDFAANATGSRAAWFEINTTGAGTRYAQNSMPQNTAAANTDIILADTLLLAAGDFVNVVAFQNSGGALNAVNNATTQSFRAHYIGPT